MRLILIKFLFICCLGLSLQGCETLKSLGSGDSDTEDEYADWNAEKFRGQAKTALDAGNYDKASSSTKRLNPAILLAMNPLRHSWILLTLITKTAILRPPSPPPTALSKSIRAVPASIMLII
jgi:hypothetical protein